MMRRNKLTPCSVKLAKAWVGQWHRHLPKIQGGLFAVMVTNDSGLCVGVGIAGNPPRVWQNTGRLIISRIATPGTENACSMIYGSLCRAAKALGYSEAWTYTLPNEPGTSLRAAGFRDMGLTKGGELDRPSRARNPVINSQPKRRWLRQLGNEQFYCENAKPIFDRQIQFLDHRATTVPETG